MTSRDFCYWLQGLFELGAPVQLDEKQTALVRQHLALVFVHEIDPSAGGAVEQAKLNAVHAGVSKDETESAIKEALAKLPRPQVSHGHGNTILRC